jgi:hypothetical protein
MEFSLWGVAMGAMEIDLRENVQRIYWMAEEDNCSAGFDLAPGHNKCAIILTEPASPANPKTPSFRVPEGTGINSARNPSFFFARLAKPQRDS